MRGLQAAAGVLLGFVAAWLAGHAATALYAPRAPEPGALDDVAALTFLAALAILCPLLAWVGWRIGNRKR